MTGGKATDSQKRRKTDKRREGAKNRSFPGNINNRWDTPKGAPLQNRGRKLSLQKCKIWGQATCVWNIKLKGTDIFEKVNKTSELDEEFSAKRNQGVAGIKKKTTAANT